MNYNHVYDSRTNMYEVEYQIDLDSDTPLKIEFTAEKVILEIDRNGNAVFCDAEGIELYREKAVGPERYFSKVFCMAYKGRICVRFPITELVDHYPNCDGEYDRWSERTVDNVNIRFVRE